MRVELTETQRQLRDTVRAFARERIAPVAAEIDRTGRYPRDLLTGLADLGALGVFVPEEFGGAGFDHVSYALAVEEVAAACAATAACYSAHASLVCWPILAAGTPAQRRRYLPRLARGEWLGSFALSEPGVGSDAGALATTARRKGDGWVLNGAKNFITNASEAGLAIVFATVDASKGHRGIGAFLVETTTPGWEVLRVEEKMGLHGAHTAQLAFTDLYVPHDSVLGEEQDGFKLAMRTLDGGRIGIAAQAVGIARAALEASLAYSKERRAFGQALADFQGTQWKLADMATMVEAARLLTLRAATLKDQGKPYTKEASMAKLYASEAAMAIATQAVQIHGGYGYTREFPAERHFRDAKATEIYEGSSEIQRLIIADQVLREGA
jgi:alkylation response protein AidB-like acyl-CoA dehydrogenase